jgi:hypothetical protein
MTSLLEVYYCVDMDTGGEENLGCIERCLRTFIEVNYREYTLKKFERYVKARCVKNDDVIKNGLYTFNKMYNEYKLKSSEKIWFIYISNGNIKTMYKNICVVLLNDNPVEKECFYVVNKKSLIFSEDMSRELKVDYIKRLNKYLQELFDTQQVIKYENFNV